MKPRPLLDFWRFGVLILFLFLVVLLILILGVALTLAFWHYEDSGVPFLLVILFFSGVKRWEPCDGEAPSRGAGRE